MNVRELAYTAGDLIATHNLLDYMKPGEDKLRIVTGATLGALGYGLGPLLENKLSNTEDAMLANIAKEDVIYAAGGAAIGAIGGYLAGNDFVPTTEVGAQIREAIQSDDPKRPGGLITVLGVGWLGYSLFVAEQDDEFRQRQHWGLGAAALGYLAGPEILDKTKDLIVPRSILDDTTKIYQAGSAAFGGVLGVGAGLWLRNKRT